MLQKIEGYIIKIITGEKHGFPAHIIRIFLSLLELVYICLLKLHKLLYRCNIIKSHSLNCKVVSVGNISAGGTGKTPVVERLSKIYSDRGKKVVILSRGYGSGQEGPLIVSDEEENKISVENAGDEVYMLARHLDGIPIVIGKDRYQAGQLAEKKFNPDIIILDDGFQHWKLNRDIDIVTVDAMNPFGCDHLIPRGFLREPLSAFQRADIIVLSKTDHVSQKDVKKIKNRLRLFNKQADILTSRHEPLYIKSLTSYEDKVLSADKLKGKKVLALCGIGNPESFVEGLKKLDAKVIDSITYPDHYKYQEEDLMEIAVQAQLSNVDWVVTTEKDAVKFSKEMVDRFQKFDIGIFTLGIEIKLNEYSKLANAIS